MTNQEILKKAIEKAEANGYLPPKAMKHKTGEVYNILEYPLFVIFSHNFAKAFFPTISNKHKAEIIKSVRKNKASTYKIFDWQYHLQQMVLEEEPLLYLKKFL